MTDIPPPDFAASFFSLQRLPGLLQTRGAVLLRRLLPPALLARWLPVFEAAYAEADRRLAADLIDADTWRNYYQFGHVDPELIPNYQGWLDVLLQQQTLRHVLRSALGPNAGILTRYSTTRRQSAAQPQHAIGFHQDREFIGPLNQALNLWIPLTPAGGPEWPGLELWLDGPQRPLLDFGMAAAERDAVCAEIPASALWRPQLLPGDVLIFTHLTVHRTAAAPRAQGVRYSFELRMTPDTWAQSLASVRL